MNEKCNTTIDYGFDDGLRLERVSHIVPAAEGTENKLSNDGKIIQISPERIKELEVNPWLDINKDQKEKVIEQLKDPRYIRGLGGIGIEVAIIGDPNAEELQAMAGAVPFVIQTLSVKQLIWFTQIQMLPIW